MRILITNDDGIHSPGLLALAEVAAQFGQVRVVAPSVEQSAMSHAITISRPLHYYRTHLDGVEAYRVDGTPADCAALGLYNWDGADLVLSGINYGSNLGYEIWHSGTVAAAKQAALLGVQAVAFSFAQDGNDLDFHSLADSVAEVIRLLTSSPAPLLVNVNFPAKPRGLRWTRQSVRTYSGKVVEGRDPLGREHYWFVGAPTTNPGPGTDRLAIEEGYTSLTPLSLGVTDENWLARLQLAETWTPSKQS